MQKDSGRAPRFDLPLPLDFRSAGAGPWSHARIENISRSGVLFRAERPLPVDSPVEMTFELPVGAAKAELVCRGRVVRVVDGHGEPAGIAATISAFRFRRGRNSHPAVVAAPDTR